MIELGGNIVLQGFKDRDYAELIVVKKLVGRYARQITDRGVDLTELKVSMKAPSSRYEMEASCDVGGKTVYASAEDRNLFVTLDSVLKKIVGQL